MNIIEMARAAEKDDRLSDGALYGKLADEIERLGEAMEQIVQMADGAYASSWMTMPDAWQRINDIRIRARAALSRS